MKVRNLIISFIVLLLIGCGGGKTLNMEQAYMLSKGYDSKFSYPPIKPPYSELAYPIRFPEEVLRVWIPDYINDEGVLVQGHYIWVIVRKGRWYVEGGPYLPALKKEPKTLFIGEEKKTEEKQEQPQEQEK